MGGGKEGGVGDRRRKGVGDGEEGRESNNTVKHWVGGIYIVMQTNNALREHKRLLLSYLLILFLLLLFLLLFLLLLFLPLRVVFLWT